MTAHRWEASRSVCVCGDHEVWCRDCGKRMDCWCNCDRPTGRPTDRATDLLRRSIAFVLIATAVPIIRALGLLDDLQRRGEDDG